MQTPNPMFAELPPGQRRLSSGAVYVFDADAHLDWLAVEAHLNAPDDLSRLSDDDLALLLYRGLRIFSLSKGADRDLVSRVEGERARRRGAASRAEAA